MGTLKISRWCFSLLVMLVLVRAGWPADASQAQTTERPLILPLAEPPGLNTWLFGQPFGNTVGSFNFGREWYSAGQGMHFGIDLPMPCGTVVVAAADGEVVHVDNFGFGAGPHNVLISHPQLQIITLYGHLLERAQLNPGQPVRQGDPIGLSGDPDVTCVSRPHLHFEVRSPDYFTAYNPIVYIDAPWHMLASIGGYGYPLFQQDLMNARRWLSVDDQPAIQFGGRMLNNYTLAWPPPSHDRPPDPTLPHRNLGPLPATTRWQLRQISTDGCCAYFWWHPTDPTRLYVIDGLPGQVAGVYEWDVQHGTPPVFRGAAPPAYYSPDGTYEIQRSGGQVFILDTIRSMLWSVNTGGRWPAISPGNLHLLWRSAEGRSIPGSPPPPVTFWMSNLDGSGGRLLTEQRGGSARWIDDYRILMTTPLPDSQQAALSIYDSRDATTFTLGIWERMRGVEVSPGGKYILFYLAFQPAPAQNGIYIIETERGAEAVQLLWFGGWRWRDSESLYYLPFDPATANHTLAYYHLASGENRILTNPAEQPFTVANGEWAVSADGRRIAFQNPDDSNLWLLEAIE